MTDAEILGRLGLAALLGGILGLDRELHQQQAGLRTHMVLSIGACLATLTGLQIAFHIEGADPGRIIGHILSGIGFLGAGAIVRHGLTVQGLTTAAGLWAAATLGIASGAGYWKSAVAAAAGVLVVTGLLDKAENRLFGGNDFREIRFEGRDGPDVEDRFKRLLSSSGFSLKRLEVSRRPVDGRIEFLAVARVRSGTDPGALSRALAALPGAESSTVR